MSNLKMTVFDILAYILPGGVMLLAGMLLYQYDICVFCVVERSNKLTLQPSLLLASMAYIIGFAQYGAKKHFTSLFSKQKKKENDSVEKEKNKDSKTNDKESKVINYNTAENWAMIREFSPANLEALDRWGSMKGMSKNLSFSFGFLSVVGIIRLVIACINCCCHCITVGYLLLPIGSIVLTFLLIRKTTEFRNYLNNDLRGSIEVVKIKSGKEIHSSAQK